MANIARPRVVGTDEDGLPFDLPDRVTIALAVRDSFGKHALIHRCRAHYAEVRIMPRSHVLGIQLGA